MFSAVKRWKTKDKRDSRGISDGGPSSTRPLSSGEAPKNQLGPPKASPSSVNQQIQRAPLAIDTNKRADRLLESGIGYDDSKKPTKGFLSMCQDGDRADAIAYATQHASEFAASLHIPIDPNGNTALHLAVAYNDFLLVALLLQRGANPNAFNRSNVTPTMLAKRMSYSKLVRVLKSCIQRIRRADLVLDR
ncbi:hypothetical protein BJ742DRAFT_173453 [Cladochytrium replicatum]|nr:hypothetical protein BJ742DRAFT_173453 [Cladochytrium replicatum]